MADVHTVAGNIQLKDLKTTLDAAATAGRTIVAIVHVGGNTYTVISKQ